MKKILRHLSFAQNSRRLLILKGILSKSRAFKGPDIVQIDLTDKCNSNCYLCWNHSLHLKSGNGTFLELDFNVLNGFIKDIANAGTKEIIFSGGGEPFLYPRIWDVLELAQNLGLIIRLNTNFTLLEKEQVQRLLKIKKLYSVTVSIWAKDENSFAKIHNRSEEIYAKFKNSLSFLNKNKKPGLLIRAYSVIGKYNYRDIVDLADFAYSLGCDEIEFGLPDIIPGQTDQFLLTKEELSFVLDSLKVLESKISKMKGFKVANSNLFIRRLSSPKAHLGIYDELTENFPCFAGWSFLRLRANGDLNFCLKSHRNPIGNIYISDFKSCWNSPLEQEFRRQSLIIPKNKDFFSLIGNSMGEDVGCKRVCDNILVNQSINRFMRFLN